MAFAEISGQYKYTGKGPVDAKSLVKTYADLLNEATWLSKSGSNIAYNGMIVAVWLNKDDPSKNGIYFLFDPACTTTIKNPDVTVEGNWHKLCELSDLSSLEDRISELESSGVGGGISTDELNTAINELRAEIEACGYAKTADVDAAIAALQESLTTNIDDAISAIPVVKSGAQIELNGNGELTIKQTPVSTLYNDVDRLIFDCGNAFN